MIVLASSDLDLIPTLLIMKILISLMIRFASAITIGTEPLSMIAFRRASMYS